LLIVGGGDVIGNLKKIVGDNNLEDRVWFITKQPIEILRKYTAASNLGITLDKANNINYKLSLPNKLFDYIHAGIPVLSSDLPELKNIVVGYDIGKISPDHNPLNISKLIDEMLFSDEQIKKWEENTAIAAKDLNWDKEKENLLSIFKKIG
jgi:glycosyltransferase involved in cell wall biosynthesis